MSLQRLEINGLRNLYKTQLESCERINILSGPNGSGKTSALEAIYLIGMGRSFRSNKLAALINHELEALTIFGGLAANHPDGYQSIGLMRSRHGKQELKINCTQSVSTAELARALPVRVINSDSFALMDGGPKARRQLMDWGVFHVKPAFLEYWRRAQRSLKQRNHLLKHHRGKGRDRITSAEFVIWDLELSQSATAIDVMRAQYLNDMLPFFVQALRRLMCLPGLTLEYNRGWNEGEELLSALDENFERDIRLGTTSVGPHRANLEIKVKGLAASEVLSRGQQKMVVSALQLAQGKHLIEQMGLHCVYLVDDLPAELDANHRAAFCELLDEMKCQVFMTSVDADVIDDRWQDRSAVRRFHVEQGQIFCN